MSDRFDKEAIDILQFLYEKRLVLFNYRRGHEWRVFFGFISLLLAADVAVISGRVRGDSWLAVLFVPFLIVLVSATVYYEWELQRRNVADRDEMKYIHDELAKLVRLPEPLLEVGQTRLRDPKLEDLWAFVPQLIVILLFALFSLFVVFGFVR